MKKDKRPYSQVLKSGVPTVKLALRDQLVTIISNFIEQDHNALWRMKFMMLPLHPAGGTFFETFCDEVILPQAVIDQLEFLGWEVFDWACWEAAFSLWDVTGVEFIDDPELL